MSCLGKTYWEEEEVECYYTIYEVQLPEEADCNKAI